MNCNHCNQEFPELRISINGQGFCSWKCENLHNYRPDMTDETYENDRVIDKLQVSKRETIILKTTSSDFQFFSGNKVIAIKQRGFTQKQIGNYHTVKRAREDWERVKKHYKKPTWVDLKGEDFPEEKEPKPKLLDISETTIEQLQSLLEKEKKTRQSLAHDLSKTAEHLEDLEYGSKERKNTSKEYSEIAEQLFEADINIAQLTIGISQKRGEPVTEEMYNRLKEKTEFLKDVSK